MTRWRTPRKLMVAASAVLAVIAGAAIWWNAWLAWYPGPDVDVQMVAPSAFALTWAALLLMGGIFALVRRTSAILILGWLLCLGHAVYWATKLLSPSWWTSEGLHMPGLGRLAADGGVFLGWPVLGFLLLLPELLQRRREKVKTDGGIPE